VKKTLQSRRPRLVNRSSPPRHVHHRPHIDQISAWSALLLEKISAEGFLGLLQAQLRPDPSSWLLPIPGADPTRACTPQAPAPPELACGGTAALPDAPLPPLVPFPSSPCGRGCLGKGSQREIWGVWNQLGALGNMTCIEKIKTLERLGRTKKQRAKDLLLRMGWWSGSGKRNLWSFGKLGCFRTCPKR
jgi:hypothetical protein